VIDWRRPAIAFAVAVCVCAAVAAGLPARTIAQAGRLARTAATALPWAGPATLDISARLVPPEYTGLDASDLRNPERIEAVQGTTLRMTVGGDPEARVRLSDRLLGTARVREGVAAEAIALAESGYIAIESGRGSRLIPVLVTPDRLPEVRIAAPGRDLLLPAPRVLPVTASAIDDFALAHLELRYTKVSGSGEQFEFEEGRLALAVRRTNERAWEARGTLDLAALDLEPGDALVYRAVARDRRPGGAGLAASDTYFVEIQGPGQVPLDGVEMPPDQERYALSQQMVLLKIQRLRERERAMARAAVEEEAAAIAAEQRAVRANFIFLMGGHVEDEFEEAEQSHEIQEGRLENDARRDIYRAIQQMSLAEQGLVAVDTGRALPPARAAVEALQRAFGHNRYILRALSPRGRIDPSRRLSGSLDAAAGWRRDLERPDGDERRRRVHDVLGAIVTLAAAVDGGHDVDGASVTVLAERALAIDPASPAWQDVSRRLLELRDALSARRPAADVARTLSDALRPVLDAARAGAPGPATDGTTRPGALRGAWVDEVRR
jgi:hypothetical protein